MRAPRSSVTALGLGVAGFLIDLAAKNAAIEHLDPTHPPVLLGGLLTLQLIRNPGAAFSMGESMTVGLTVLAIVALAFVALGMVPRVAHRGWVVAEGFLLAGISGNLADRLFREPGPFHGHVIDFLQLPHFAIFNVADMFITAAAALIVWLVAVAQVGPDGRSTRDGGEASRS